MLCYKCFSRNIVINIRHFCGHCKNQGLHNGFAVCILWSEQGSTYWSVVVKIYLSQPYVGWKYIAQSIFPALRTIYFSQLLETGNKFIAWNYCFSGPTNIYLFKLSNMSRIKDRTCSKLTIKAQDIILVSLLFTLNIFDKLF